MGGMPLTGREGMTSSPWTWGNWSRSLGRTPFPKGQRERQETPRASPPQCPAGGGHGATAAVKCMRVWPPIKARRKNLQELPFLQLYVSAQRGVAILLFSSFQSNPSQETQLLKNLRVHHLTCFPSALSWYLCYVITWGTFSETQPGASV